MINRSRLLPDSIDDVLEPRGGPRRPRVAPTSARVGSPRFDAVRAELAALPVKGWDRGQDFQRYQFVEAWSDDVSVEIDHVVSLADAWYKGARFWDPQRRLDFANDARNLLAVSPKANFDKAFRDAASWLPPDRAFQCNFVARQIDVETAYGLWVSAKEKKAMADVLARC